MNAGVQYVLPASAIAASPRPASDAVALVMGHMGASIVSAGMAISMLVTLNGTIMSGARVPFAVARDGYFFSRLGRSASALSYAVRRYCGAGGLVDLLLLLGGNFRQLFSLAIFAEWLFYMIAGSTVFVFRWRDPQAARPYRVLGYPVVPALFVARGRRPSLLHLQRELAEFFLRTVGYSGRRAGFLLVSLAEGS